MSSIFNPKDNREDLEFMSEVDAAFAYRGSPWAYVLATSLLGLCLIFLAWSCVKERDEVTQGQGQITPSLGVQPVQSEDGGIIKEIFVTENELVEKGTLLASISNVRVLHEFEELSNKRDEFEMALIRLKAQENHEDLVFTPEQLEAYPRATADQVQLFQTSQAQFESEGRELQAVLEQRRYELAEANQRRVQYEKSLTLLRSQERQVAPLVPKRFSEVEYLNLKQRIVTLEGEVKRLAAEIARSTSAVHEAEERLQNREPERQAAILKESNEIRQQLASVQEQLKAGSDLVQRQELRALVRGTVKRILLKEEAVVRPAELIMEILPADDALEVEARFKPANRAFLGVGQNATVKVSAYDSTVYGDLSATVLSISPDTIEDNRGEPWYEVRLRTNSTSLSHGGKELEIKPGMTVTVDVLSGKKTILGYLVKPFFKSRQTGRALQLEDQVHKGPVDDQGQEQEL